MWERPNFRQNQKSIIMKGYQKTFAETFNDEWMHEWTNDKQQKSILLLIETESV